MKNVITNFYKKINVKICNCRNKSNCPLDNKCEKLLKSTDKIVHNAEAETNDGINELYAKVNLVSARQNLCLSTTIACFTICFIVKNFYLLIIITDYIFSIIHATLSNFHIIATEDLVVFVISTKTFIQQM